MRPFINLLPWRQQRRSQHMRRWSLIVAGCLVSLVIAGVVLPNSMAWQQDLQHFQREYLLQMDSGLQRLHQNAQALKKRQQLQEKANAQRQAFKSWEGRLSALASQLPTSVWLISLSLKNDQMLIKGHATRAEDIQLLEKSLQILDGVSAVKAGTIQQNTPGQMLFTFTVNFSGGGHALPG